MTSSRRQPQGNLETVIDEPLERRQGPNHRDSDGQSVPETLESDVAVDPRHGFPGAFASCWIFSRQLMISTLRNGLGRKERKKERKGIRTLPVSVQLADHHVCRVTDDRASNTRNVPTQKTHSGLLQRVVALLGLPQGRINVVDRRLKRREFHHRVWNLPAPQRIQPLV